MSKLHIDVIKITLKMDIDKISIISATKGNNYFRHVTIWAIDYQTGERHLGT